MIKLGKVGKHIGGKHGGAQGKSAPSWGESWAQSARNRCDERTQKHYSSEIILGAMGVSLGDGTGALQETATSISRDPAPDSYQSLDAPTISQFHNPRDRIPPD